MRTLVCGLILAAIAPVPALAEPEMSAPDIVVIARKVERVSMDLGRDPQGRTVCSLTRSSGSPRIDSAMCQRASRCMKPKMVDQALIAACIAKQRKALVRAWAKGART